MDSDPEGEFVREVTELAESPYAETVQKLVQRLIDARLDSMVTNPSLDGRFVAGGIAFGRELLSALSRAIAYGEYTRWRLEHEAKAVYEDQKQRLARREMRTNPFAPRPGR